MQYVYMPEVKVLELVKDAWRNRYVVATGHKLKSQAKFTINFAYIKGLTFLSFGRYGVSLKFMDMNTMVYNSWLDDELVKIHNQSVNKHYQFKAPDPKTESPFKKMNNEFKGITWTNI